MNRFLPLLIFLALAAIMGIGLTRNPRDIPSPIVGRVAPAFSLPSLDAPQQLSPQTFAGKVWLLNVWASWCANCRAEHPLLLSLQKEGAFIVGLNYKDKTDNAKMWLQEHGNPYAESAVDTNGAAGLDWGVYGVPETFIIDQNGIVRYKHIGPLDWPTVQEDIRPLLGKLRGDLDKTS